MDWRAAIVRTAARRSLGEDVLRHLTTFQRLGERFDLEAPSEMVSIGARTVARAVRTRSAAQVRPDWVWPHWLERQLDPLSPSFVPRGMIPVAHNVAHRNWTAVGELGRAEEAIVDPVGLVTPETDGWSIAWWVRVGDRWLVPGREPVAQRLAGDLPIVETVLEVEGGTVTHRVSAGGGRVLLEVETTTEQAVEVAFAVRPYNTEGLAVVEDIVVDVHRAQVLADGRIALQLDGPPTDVVASTYRDGDSFHALVGGDTAGAANIEVSDPAGLAQAAVVVPASPGRPARASIPLPLAHPPVTIEVAPSSADIAAGWRARLEQGTQVRLPDARLQSAVDANRAFLLLLHDPGSITPGPSTYHRFWFRDAAYLLAALDRWGFADEVADVLATYPSRQLSDGFFFSQWREWDANGAAIWSIAEHHRLTGDDALLRDLLPALRAGVSWVERTRDPLMPPGVSAEHLGPFDFYFWDDLWSLAGLRDGASLARAVGEHAAAVRVEDAYRRFEADLTAAVRRAATRVGRTCIPAGPSRGIDAGMIGSLVGVEPLRLLPADDPYVVGTLEVLRERFTVGDAFFQGISHTGLGTYLTLQLAFVELELGDARAWRRLRWMLDAATPTWTWAEAIHPRVAGGCMGDGHHGWAAADFLNFVRAVLVRERGPGEVAILGLLPPEWRGGDLAVERAPTHAGLLSYALRWDGDTPVLSWEWHRGGGTLRAPGLDPTWSTTEPAGEARLSPHTG